MQQDDQRPYLELRIPTDEELRLYEEWVNEKKREEESEQERVIEIQI
tara:strand:+ start:475 stop:615 length:141 start_codon:yes stop_codon:yes gene_type:complete